jgi:hypothetical protein
MRFLIDDALRQKLDCSGFLSWHRGHFMPPLYEPLDANS